MKRLFVYLTLLLFSFDALAANFGSKEWLLEVAKGNVPKHSIVNKFGSNSAIGTTFTPVAESGSYQTPSTLTSLEIVSDSANDAAAGTGARVVTVFGIGTGWALLQEDVTMNGTTAVALANQYFRVFRVRVKDSGTYATSAAPSHNSTITVRGSGAGATWSTIVSDGGFGLGTTEIGAYTVPTGYTAHVLNFHLDVETTKILDVIMFARENADTVAAPYAAMSARSILRGIVGEHESNTNGPVFSVTGPADIGFMAKVSTGTGKVEVAFQVLLIQD